MIDILSTVVLIFACIYNAFINEIMGGQTNQTKTSNLKKVEILNISDAMTDVTASSQANIYDTHSKKRVYFASAAIKK
jgi:hypothetical protein